MRKLLPTYRLDRKWYHYGTDRDGSYYLLSNSKRWYLPPFNLFSWKSIRNWIVYWIGKRKGLIEEVSMYA